MIMEFIIVKYSFFGITVQAIVLHYLVMTSIHFRLVPYFWNFEKINVENRSNPVVYIFFRPHLNNFERSPKTVSIFIEVLPTATAANENKCISSSALRPYTVLRGN